MTALAFSRRTMVSLIAGIFGTALVAGCGNDAPPPPKPVAVAATSATPAAPVASAAEVQTPSPAVENHAGGDVLKWLQNLPDKVAKPEPPKPDPAQATKDKAAAAQAVPVALAPVAAPAPTLAPQRVEPTPAPVARAPAPAPAPTPAPVQLASAAPTTAAPTAPPSASVSLKAIEQNQPPFPREALRDGVRAGHVRVRLSIGTDGSVKNVEVLESMPPRVFNKAVIAAAKNWRYSPIAEPTTTLADFNFDAAASD